MADNAALKNRIKALFEESIQVKIKVASDHLSELVQIAQVIHKSLSTGGKLLLCGNGGSAADAQHLAAEMLVRLRPHVNRDAIPAIALAMDSSAFTAHGNDYSFETYFSRMLSAIGKKGDILLGITTSGKSPNVLRAFEEAKKRGIITVGFLGGEGGPALPLCDFAFVVPSAVTGRIQESHITAGHAVLEIVEDLLIESGSIKMLR